jgi:hypothetical protein
MSGVSYYIQNLQRLLEDYGKAWISTDAAGISRSRSRLQNAARRSALPIRTWVEWDIWGSDKVTVHAEVLPIPAPEVRQ